MISPAGPPGPISGLPVVDPSATRQAGRSEILPAGAAGQDGRNPADAAADRSRVQPPPQIVAYRPQQRLRGGTSEDGTARTATAEPVEPQGADTADALGSEAFGQTGFDVGGAGVSDRRRGRDIALPSAPFLAQAIGQELDADGTAPAAGASGPAAAAALYRQTRDVVDRSLFRGLQVPAGSAAGYF